jgi:two-component system sensor histidine kinase VanS
MLARLEAHLLEQRRFAANASHELRTPLAVTQSLLDVARKDPDRDTGQLLDRLHEVNAQAITLTEALLTLSRAEQRSFTAERVDLSLLAEEAVEMLLPFAEQSGVAVTCSLTEALTTGSRALLAQMTLNLLHNAIVHNLPAGGTVSISTSATVDGGTLAVENSGDELAPELVSTLIEPFQRGTQRTHDGHAGVGLGLTIVNSIVQAHDGTLTIIQRNGGGLRIAVRLPSTVYQ